MTREHRPLRSVALFYFLAFTLSWLIEVPQAAAARGLIHIELPGVVGFLSALAPALAAIALSATEGGTAEVRRLLGWMLRWRVAPSWYAVVLAGLPLLGLFAVGLASVGTPRAPDLSAGYIHDVFPQLPSNLSPWLLVPPFLIYSIVTSAPEEVGWRVASAPLLLSAGRPERCLFSAFSCGHSLDLDPIHLDLQRHRSQPSPRLRPALVIQCHLRLPATATPGHGNLAAALAVLGSDYGGCCDRHSLRPPPRGAASQSWRTTTLGVGLTS